MAPDLVRMVLDLVRLAPDLLPVLLPTLLPTLLPDINAPALFPARFSLPDLAPRPTPV